MEEVDPLKKNEEKEIKQVTDEEWEKMTKAERWKNIGGFLSYSFSSAKPADWGRALTWGIVIFLIIGGFAYMNNRLRYCDMNCAGYDLDKSIECNYNTRFDKAVDLLKDPDYKRENQNNIIVCKYDAKRGLDSIWYGIKTIGKTAENTVQP